MASYDLSDARLKLKRAGEHISDLEARIAKLTGPELYRVTLEPNEGGHWIEAHFESLHDGGRHLDAVIGDAIGNLRSVLDYIMGPIVEPLGGNPAKVTFPFADNLAGFKGEVRSQSLALTPDLIEHFDKIEAYENGGGHTLWVINKLRNIDKHRLLVTTVQLAAIKFSYAAGGQICSDNTFAIGAGEKRGMIRAPAPNFQITDQPTPFFTIQFQEPGVAVDTEVMALLHSAARDVEGLLDALEKA